MYRPAQTLGRVLMLLRANETLAQLETLLIQYRNTGEPHDH
jgi:hypothetical protein